MVASAAALAKAKGGIAIMSGKVTSVAGDGTFCFVESSGRQIYISKQLWYAARIGPLLVGDDVHCKAFYNEKNKNYRADALVTVHRKDELILDARKSASAKPSAPAGSSMSYAQMQLQQEQDQERARARAQLQQPHPQPPSAAAAAAAPIRIKTMVKQVVRTRVVRVVEHPVFGSMEESSEEEREVEVEQEVEFGPDYVPLLDFPQVDVDSITAAGFSEQQARNALGAFDGNVERAVLWLCDNPDPSGDDALAGAPEPPKARSEFAHSASEEAVHGLLGMGFPEERVRQVLAVMDAESACNWLLENPDHVVPPQPAAAASSQAARPLARSSDHEAAQKAGSHSGERHFGMPELPKTGGDEAQKKGDVVECLVRLIRQTKTGEFNGTDLPLLYKEHPGAADAIKKAGGFKRFCLAYSDQFDYISDPCNPSVSKVRIAAGAAVPVLGAGVSGPVMKMMGDSQAVMTGSVTNVLPDGAVFMHAGEGGPDAYIPRKMAAGLKMGETVRVIANNVDNAKGKWRAVVVNPTQAQVDEVMRLSGVQEPLPRVPDEAGPARKSVEAAAPPKDPRKELLRMGVSEEDAAQALFLFQDNFEEAVKWLRSEGAEMHVRPRLNSLGELDQDDGDLPKRPSGKDADAMLECVVREARKHDGELRWKQMSLILSQRATSKQELKAWGGLNGFCALRSETLEHTMGTGGKEQMVRLKKQQKEPQRLPMRALVTGIVVKEGKNASFHMMESVPGVSDVFVPRAVTGKHKLSVSQTVTVLAEEKLHNRTRWVARFVKDMVSPYTGIVFASSAAEERYKELLLMSPAQMAQAKGLQVSMMTGHVTALHEGHVFVTISQDAAGRGSDQIWIPKEVLNDSRVTLQMGDYVTLAVVPSEREEKTGGQGLRAEYIEQVHGANNPQQQVYGSCVCGVCGVCTQRAKAQVKAQMHVVQQGAAEERKVGEPAASRAPANPFALLGEDAEGGEDEDDSESSASAHSRASGDAVSSDGECEEGDLSSSESGSESAHASLGTHPKKPVPQDRPAASSSSMLRDPASKGAPSDVPKDQKKELHHLEKASDQSADADSGDEPVSAREKGEGGSIDLVAAGKKCKEDGNAEFRLAKGEHFASKSESAAQHYSRALEHFKQIASPDQDTKIEMGRTHANRAACMLNLTRHQDALDDCTRALKLDPTNWKASLRQSICYVSLANILVKRIDRETEAKRGSKPTDETAATRQIVSEMFPAKEHLAEAESCHSQAFQIQTDIARRDGLKPPSWEHQDYANVSKAIKKVRDAIDEVMSRLVCDGFWNGRESDSESDQFEECDSRDPEDSGKDGDSSDADSVSSSSTVSDDVPVPDDLFMVMCPNVECGAPLCLQSPHFESVQKEMLSYVTPPCPRCECRFPFESLPELPYKTEKGLSTEGLLTSTAMAVWKQAKAAECKKGAKSGEHFLDKAWNKLKLLDDQPQRNHAPIPEYGDNSGLPVPGRLLSGMRIMLEHCVHTRDAGMLSFLTGIPERLHLSIDFNEESIDKLKAWVCHSWVTLMRQGILELIIDSDEKHLPKDKPPPGPTGGLFAVVLESLLGLADWLLELDLDGMSWEWLFEILEPVLDIPEHASDLRVDSAVYTVKSLAERQNAMGANYIEDFVSRQSRRKNLDALTLSCRSRRAKVVSAVLEAAPRLVNSSIFQPPLHTACQLPHVATVHEVIVNYPSVKRSPLEFVDWGFSWTLRVTKAGEILPTQQWCNCGVHCFHKFTVSAQKRKEEMQELMKEKDGKPFLSAHLDLRDSQILGPCRVKVTLRIEVAGLSEPQNFDIYYDHDNGVDGSPVHFMLVDDKQTEVLLDSGKNLSFKVSLAKLTARGMGIRRLRTPEEVQVEQEEIVKILIKHGANVDLFGRSGQTALSLAIEAGLSESVCNLVIPKSIPAAITAMFCRKDVMTRELDMLLSHLPPSADASDINVSALVRKIGNFGPEKAKGKGDVKLERLMTVLNDFLKRGLSLPEFNLCLKAAVESRSWNVLDRLLRFKPKEADASGLAVHDVVSTASIQILQVLLEARANPNAARTTHQVDGETPLHVAARTGRLEAIELLLQSRADCNVKEKKSGNTPLHEAATTVSGQEAARVVELMMQAGADTNAKNMRKLTPLQVAKDKIFRTALQTKMSEMQAAKKKMLERKRQEEADAAQPSAAGMAKGAGGAPVKAGGDSGDAGVVEKEERVLTYEERIEVVNAMIDEFNASGESEVSEDAGAGAAQGGSKEDDRGEEEVPDVDDADDILSPRLMSLTLPGSVVEWDMRFTRDFRDQFVMLRSRRGLLALLIRVLQRLGSGEVCEELVSPVRGTPIDLNINVSSVQSVQGSRNLYVVWQWAPDYSPRIRGYCDTIRLYALVYEESDVSAVADLIVQSHVRGRSSSVKRQLKPTAPAVLTELEGRRKLPRTYEVGEWEDVDRLLREEEERHMVLVGPDGGSWRAHEGTVLYTPPAIASADSYNVLKFYSMDDTVLRNVSAPGAQTCLPELFIPDEREDSFIHQDLQTRSSALLLVGRSGTGKTSIAVGRMWSLFREWQLSQRALVSAQGTGSSEGGQVKNMLPGYNQVFVTGNRVLRDQVRKSFGSMKQSYLDDFSTPLVTQYPPTWNHGITHDMFPMFLTQTEWLLMLDGSLPDPFFPRHADGSLQVAVEGGFHEEVGMLDNLDDLSDGEGDWLQDEDDDEDDDVDDQIDEGEEGREPHQRGSGGKKGHSSKMRHKEIDWSYFFSRMWPKFTMANAQAKSLSASAVFAEIHSFIKGSFSALDKPEGRLPREEYLRLPTKMAPNFKGLSTSEKIADLPGDRRGNRDLVYDLFEAYEAEKKRLNAYDISDLVHNLWLRLQKTPYSGAPIHALFVDETQDFVQAELRLFLHICANKNDTFFSGDTCQTIASGVGFRFEDLKQLFRAEQESERLEAEAAHTHVPNQVAIPRVKNLQLNYRTHNGILSAAAGIVDLIECFFPGSIDILPRERGFFDGPKPLLLKQTNVDDAAVLIVGSDKKNSQIEFGAHQCILVRTQEAKKRLPEDFGGCLSLTIVESKGLEFDDVFLWNFITDSRAEHEWRLVLAYLLQDDEGDAEMNALEAERAKAQNKDVSGMLRTLDFAEHQHQIFCEELKHLYTAVTRARVRVVIYDEDVRKRAPMFHYLQRRDLVQTLAFFTSDSYVPMAVQSGVDEWRTQGKNLRDNGLYQLAAKCFRQSGDRELELESYALHLSCRRAAELQGKDRMLCFFEAGENFLQARQGVKAARCFYEAGEFDLAGKTFMSCTKGAKPDKEEGLLRDAIRSFRKGGKVLKALDLLVKLGKLRTALRLLKDDHKYLKAIEVLENNPSFTPPADLSVDIFISLAAAQHAAARNAAVDEAGRALATERFLQVASRLSEDQEEDLLRRYGFRDALVSLLVKRRRTVEAARIMCVDGKALEGALLLDSAMHEGREAVEMSTELHLSHALSGKCKNSAETSLSLSRALASCRRVLELDEKALQEAKQKLRHNLEGGSKDDLEELGVGDLRRLAVQSGVKMEGVLVSATPTGKEKLEKLRQMARDVGLEINAPDRKTFCVAIEKTQCQALRNAIAEKRRTETAGSAVTASLRAEVVRLEGMVKKDSLHRLQIEFELALRSADGPERVSRIEKSLSAAKDGNWVVAVALLQHEAIMTDAQSVASAPSSSLLVQMRNSLDDLEGVLRLLKPAKNDPKMRNETPEYLKIEQFFGLKREDGMCCISPTLKVLLDARLDVGQCFKKGDLFVVDPRAFREALARETHRRAVDVSLLIRNEVVHQVSLQQPPSLPTVQLAILRVWIVNDGIRRLNAPRVSAKERTQAVFKRPNVATDINLPKVAFSTAQLREACERLECMICPSIYAPDGDGTALANSKALTDTNTSWTDQLASARQTMRKYAEDMYKTWQSQPLGLKSAELLSRCLLVLERAGFFMDHRHKVNDVKRSGCDGWHPPFLQGFNPFFPLHMAFAVAGRNQTSSSSWCWMAKYLSSRTVGDYPLDTFTTLEQMTAACLVVLSSARKHDEGVATGPHKAGDDPNITCVTYLPLSMAGQFHKGKASRPNLPEVQYTLFTGMRAAIEILHSLRHCGRSSEAVEARATLILWTVLVNFAIHAGHAAAHQELVSLWDPSWVSLIVSTVAAARLEVHEGSRIAGGLGNSLKLLSLRPPSSGPLHAPMVPTADTFQELARMLGTSLSVVRIKKNYDLTVQEDVSVSVLNNLLLVGTRALGYSSGQDDAQLHMQELLEPLRYDPSTAEVDASGAGPGRAEEQEEASGQKDQQLSMLEAELRAARILCRFSRFCLLRFALKRCRERLVKEAADFVLLESTMLQPLSSEAGADSEGLSQGATGVRDPFQRSMRYRMYSERAMGTHDTGMGIGLFNGSVLLVDNSLPGFDQVKASLATFQNIYVRNIVPVMIRADAATVEIQAFSAIDEFMQFSALAEEVYTLLATLQDATQRLEEALEDVDRNLLWERACVATHDNPIRMMVWMLQSEVLPHAENSVAALLTQKRQYEHLVERSVDVREVITSRLSKGDGCFARYESEMWRPATVLDYSQRGYRIEFLGVMDEEQSIQDTKIEDVLPLAIDVDNMGGAAAGQSIVAASRTQAIIGGEEWGRGEGLPTQGPGWRRDLAPSQNKKKIRRFARAGKGKGGKKL